MATKKHNRKNYNKNHFTQNIPYIDSNVAYKLETVEYPHQYVVKKKKKRRVLNEKRILTVQKLKLILSVGVIFVGCITTMVVYAQISQQRVNLSNLKNELLLLQEENNSIKADIADTINLDYVAKEAKERLGMSEPQPYQIIYIDVPKQSYTLQYDNEEEDKQQDFSITNILNIFNNKE